MTKRITFENVIKWLKELKANAEPDVVIMLVGNKVDLCTEDSTVRKVTKEEGEKLALQHKALFQETSATHNINVKSTFETLMQKIYDSIESTGSYGKKENSRDNYCNNRNKGKAGINLVIFPLGFRKEADQTRTKTQN